MKKLLFIALLMAGAGYVYALTDEEKVEYALLIQKEPELLTEEEQQRLDELDRLAEREIEILEGELQELTDEAKQ